MCVCVSPSVRVFMRVRSTRPFGSACPLHPYRPICTPAISESRKCATPIERIIHKSAHLGATHAPYTELCIVLRHTYVRKPYLHIGCRHHHHHQWRQRRISCLEPPRVCVFVCWCSVYCYRHSSRGPYVCAYVNHRASDRERCISDERIERTSD